MGKKCYYEVLEVDIEASSELIQKSFRNLVKQWHPDICKLPEAENMIKQLNEAYEVLKDDYTRDRYDSEKGYDLKKQQREELQSIKEEQDFYVFKMNSEEIQKNASRTNMDIGKSQSEAFSNFKTIQNNEKYQSKKPKEQKKSINEEYNSSFTKYFFPTFIIFIVATIIYIKNKG